MTAIENDRVLEQNMELFVSFLFFGSLFRERRDLHPRARGKFIERLFEIKVLALHHKLEDIPALVALTKATPRSRLGPNHKGRRVLVIVERTKACIVPARMAQLDPRLRDQVYDIYFGFNLINDRHVGGIIDSIEWNGKSTEHVTQ